MELDVNSMMDFEVPSEQPENFHFAAFNTRMDRGMETEPVGSPVDADFQTLPGPSPVDVEHRQCW
jgi:hypothetical protein